MKKGSATRSIDKAEQSFRLFHTLQNDTAGFENLRDILEDWTGIHLLSNPANQLKMANRLSRVLLSHEINNYQDYARLLRRGTPKHMSEFISALTTNTTRFFRENQHFDIFKGIIEKLLEEKSGQDDAVLRIWCAAASTGQEAYTLAISIMDLIQDKRKPEVKILATDVDEQALDHAAKGIYQEKHLKEVTPLQLVKYFDPIRKEHSKEYRIHRNIQKIIRFAPFNLHSSPYPFKHKFDVIFCRNVLIYFSRTSAQAIVERLTDCLNIGGYLFVGHSEVGYVRSKNLRMKEYSVYERIKG